MLYVYAPLPAIFIYSIYIRRFGKYSSVPNITAKVAPSPHEVRLTPLDTNPVFQCLGGKYFPGGDTASGEIL